MKNAILIFAAAFSLLFVSCEREIKLDTSDVPSVVIEAFNEKYPVKNPNPKKTNPKTVPGACFHLGFDSLDF